MRRGDLEDVRAILSGRGLETIFATVWILLSCESDLERVSYPSRMNTSQDFLSTVLHRSELTVNQTGGSFYCLCSRVHGSTVDRCPRESAKSTGGGAGVPENVGLARLP